MSNNRGWGLRSELWICLAITVFFGIAVILINRVFNNVDNNMILSSDKNRVEETKKQNSNDSLKENDKKEETNNNYELLEDKLVIAGTKYVNKYLLNGQNETTKIVTIVRLQTENILEKLEINNIKCSGYIEIEKINDDFKYYPYINCGNLYKTVGYNEFLDNTDL